MKSQTLVLGCLTCLVAFVSGCHFLAWCIIPVPQAIRIPVAEFSGDRVSASFICPAPDTPHLELQFDDKAYFPPSSGTVKVYGQGCLLVDTGFDRLVKVSHSHGKAPDRPYFRITFPEPDRGILFHKFETGREYRVELTLSPPVPRAALIFLCTDFRPGFEKWRHPAMTEHRKDGGQHVQ